MSRFALLAVIVLYFGGCVYVDGMVRDACTHGNCVHGRYSKNNSGEKAVALAWKLGFPIVAWLLWPSRGKSSSNINDARPRVAELSHPVEEEKKDETQKYEGTNDVDIDDLDVDELLEKYYGAHFPTFAEAAEYASTQSKLHKISLKVERSDFGWRVFNPEVKSAAIFVADENN